MDVNNSEFWKLVEPEHLRAQAFCRKLAGNREEGDDLCQDSLVRALSGFKALRKRSSFRPWLYRIIINTFQSNKKSSFWNRFRPMDEKALDIPGDSDIEAASALRRRLEAALSTISDLDRALLILFEIEGWQTAEIAAMTGRPEGNIRTRLSRTRNRMRKALLKYLRKSQKSISKKTVQSEEVICVAIKSGEE